MALTRPVNLSVRWDLSVQPDGSGKLVFSGELDTESTPVDWRSLEVQLGESKLSTLDIDVRQLVSDSAGLALLYYLSTGGMIPGTNVNLSGLRRGVQHLLLRFSKEDFEA